ncbi:MAG: phenylalanine--tRNA ligase subunit alpha [Phycisphaerales bacterium]|nr:phenylalanine--tRNA ligase subunit alpha [Phycisphaerales bacterium]
MPRRVTLRAPMTTDLTTIDRIEAEALEALGQTAEEASLEAWRIAWLGSKGKLKSLMAGMKDCSPEDRPAFGQRMNALKKSLEAAFKERKNQSAPAAGPPLDVTEPGDAAGQGRRHVLARTIDEVVDVFSRMGFTVAQGPEVEDEYHNFIALNMPESHPAREPGDNFFLEGGGMLRTQTSTVQIRVMENTPPPIRVISPGRVYRPDTHDATHYSMFHQVEGLWVDQGVTLVDLKATLIQFARTYFGPDADVRMRPSFFPFTEPSAEVDIRMPVRGKMQWVELGGCGMVDPNVFKAVGYDPEVWTGYAFGLGIERIAMRKYGIPDIRWLFENDARFLRQF